MSLETGTLAREVGRSFGGLHVSPSAPRCRARVALAAVAVLAACSPARAEDSCPRILRQDPALNNLVDPPGSTTAPLGTLGGVTRAGTGSQPMILVPGFGFGGDVFDDLTKALAADFRTYAVTLPGMAGTAAPPAPSETTSFGEQTWTAAAEGAIEKLIESENLKRPVVVGHWLGGTQIALRLAEKRPEAVRAVILLAGSARMLPSDPAQAAYIATPEKRVASVDHYMAPRWFKTVTRETWDDNNFLPGDYAVNPVRGLRLWREAARPPLHVWVRYLCEFNAQDACVDLPKLAVPTLLLEPGLEGHEPDPGGDYMKGYLHDSWAGCVESQPKITVKRIPNARVGVWFDQPQAVVGAIREFLAGVE